MWVCDRYARYALEFKSHTRPRVKGVRDGEGPPTRCAGARAAAAPPAAAALLAVAADVAAQRRLCVEIQKQFWVDVPHVPVGQYYQPTAFRSDLTGMQDGFAMFWNIRRLG